MARRYHQGVPWPPLGRINGVNQQGSSSNVGLEIAVYSKSERRMLLSASVPLCTYFTEQLGAGGGAALDCTVTV